MATRRGFVQGLTGMSLLACSGEKGGDTASPVNMAREQEPEIWEPSETLSLSLFPSGIQVGDVQNGSALVGIHTSLQTIVWKLVVQVDTEWQEVQSDEVQSLELPEPLDGVIQFLIEGLTADSAYCLVAIDPLSGERSRVTRFRSGFDSTTWRNFSFAATSCLGGNYPWPSLSKASMEKFDFFLMLGDTVYTNAGNMAMAWADWQYALKVQGFQDLSASTSLIATWDDHELTNNFDWDEIADAERIHTNAMQCFRAAIPFDFEQNNAIYRKIAHGKLCDVFVLDCRGERHSQSGQYISSEQMEWLKRELKASTARFKFIMNSVPIIDFSDLIGEVEAIDRWQGYPAQRTEILGFIETEEIGGVLWLAGDFHFGMISYVSPAGAPGSSMMEVLNGPTGSFLNVMGDLFVPNDQYLFGLSAWNYTRYDCNPETGEVVVTFVSDEGEELLQYPIQL